MLPAVSSLEVNQYMYNIMRIENNMMKSEIFLKLSSRLADVEDLNYFAVCVSW